MPIMKRLAAYTVLALALMFSTWAPSALAQAGASFVGSLGDSGASIVVATDGTTFTAYVCNNGQLTDWFEGPLAPVSEAASDAGSTFSMRFVSGAPAGSVVTSDGAEQAFTTEAVLGDPNASRGDLVEGGSGAMVTGTC